MKRIIILFLIAVCFSYRLSAQTVKPFGEGDRAVFLGNSITDGGHYHSYIWLYYMTRFPEMNLRIFNAGIGGDTAFDMYKRLDGDVFSKRPTVLMVTFGMNDSGYIEYNGDNPNEFGERKYEECYKNFRLMEERLKGLPDTRMVLMGSSPFDETAVIEGNIPLKGKNAVMERIIEFQKQSATANQWEFTDFNQPMSAINKRFQQDNPSFTLCGNDRIHPDNDGHMVMAYLFLKAQGFSGQPVAEAEINAGKNAVIRSVNCEISDIRKNGKDFQFDYRANALPYPVDTTARGWGAQKSQAEALKIVPFMEEMNREMLTVTGLNGKYKLFIDDLEIGTWSSDQLAKGINLALETKTPQYRQALAIMHLNEYRWEIERCFRQYAWIQFGFFQGKGLLFADNREAIEVMDQNLSSNIWLAGHRDIYSKMIHPEVRRAREKEMEVLIDAIYEINKPVKRKMVLRKI
jgi:Lysophospholipase L1 and related esterases